MTEIELQIVDIMSRHTGRKNAIPRRILLSAVKHLIPGGDQDREMRLTVEGLRKQHGMLIAPSSSGYFMIENKTEYLKAVEYWEKKEMSNRDSKEALINNWSRMHPENVMPAGAVL